MALTRISSASSISGQDDGYGGRTDEKQAEYLQTTVRGILDERVAKRGFQVISYGTSIITWREIRRVRASFPTNAQTLYRLKSNSFPLWNWASQDLSCPVPGCSRTLPFVGQHVFWTCSSVSRQWGHLLVKWSPLMGFNITDFNVRVFGLDLPEVRTRLGMLSNKPLLKLLR